MDAFIGVLYEGRLEEDVKIHLDQNMLTSKMKRWSSPNEESTGAENLIFDSDGLMISIYF